MLAYTYDLAGQYVATVSCDADPLTSGEYLLPAQATFVAIPDTVPEGQVLRWNGYAWESIMTPGPR